MTNTPTPKTLARSDDRMIAGVCSGIAEYFGIDATLVRVVAVLSVLLGFGAGILLYVAGWLLMPDRSGQTVITWRPSPSAPQSSTGQTPALQTETTPPIEAAPQIDTTPQADTASEPRTGGEDTPRS